MDELESYDETKTDKEFTDEKIKKAKFRLLGPLNKTHNIVIHIRSSDDRRLGKNPLIQDRARIGAWIIQNRS
jgi:hypothetical protein